MQPNFQKGEHESDASYHRQQQHDDGDVHVRHVHDDARPKIRLALFSPHLTVACHTDFYQVRKTSRVFRACFILPKRLLKGTRTDD